VTDSKGTIFISYTSADRAWAHWIGVALRDNGYKPLVHEWAVGPGENIARWMDESLATAERMLGIFTDAYAKALYSSSERWAAYWQDPDGRKGFHVPVEVEPVTEWPPLTRPLKRLSLVGLSEAEAEVALLAFLEPPQAPARRPPFPGQTSRDSLQPPSTGFSPLENQAERLPASRPAWPPSSVDGHDAGSNAPAQFNQERMLGELDIDGRGATIFLNVNDVTTWLDRQSAQAACVFAVRAVMRALPALVQALNSEHPPLPDESEQSRIVLRIFRQLSTAWATAAFPSHRSVLQSAAKLAVSGRVPSDSLSRHPSAAGARNACAAAAASAESEHVHLAVSCAIDAAETAGGEAFKSMLDAMSQDAQQLGRRSEPVTLAHSQLWPMPIPQLPKWAGRALDESTSRLDAANEDWSVWTGWYKERLFAETADQTLEIERATIPDKRWRQHPGIVNAHIKRLIADRRLNETLARRSVDGTDHPEPGNRQSNDLSRVPDEMGAQSQSPIKPSSTVNSTAPTAIPGVISPVDFAAAPGKPIRATPSADAQPALKTHLDKGDHKPRLDLCRATASRLVEMIETQRLNVRRYHQPLSDYVKHLPPNAKKRNFLFADQEARIIRDMFAAEAGILPPEFAARLRALLISHQALRVFYPGIARFYDDVRFGRSGEPLPIDAAESVSAVVANAPEIFDASVSRSLSDAAPALPIPPAEDLPPPSPADPQPPPDPLGSVPTDKAQAYTRASIINRLWGVFSKAEPFAKNSEAWVKIGNQLAPHVRDVIHWLSAFTGGPPPSS
jgi:hypothetical protein